MTASGEAVGSWEGGLGQHDSAHPPPRAVRLYGHGCQGLAQGTAYLLPAGGGAQAAAARTARCCAGAGAGDSGRFTGGRAATLLPRALLLLLLLAAAAAPAAAQVEVATCDQQRSCIQWRVRALTNSSCAFQVRPHAGALSHQSAGARGCRGSMTGAAFAGRGPEPAATHGSRCRRASVGHAAGTCAPQQLASSGGEHQAAAGGAAPGRMQAAAARSRQQQQQRVEAGGAPSALVPPSRALCSSRCACCACCARPQVCLFWRPGSSCQIQPDDTLDTVCVRQSSFVRWGSAGTTTPGGACQYQVRGRCASGAGCSLLLLGSSCMAPHT